MGKCSKLVTLLHIRFIWCCEGSSCVQIICKYSVSEDNLMQFVTTLLYSPRSWTSNSLGTEAQQNLWQCLIDQTTPANQLGQQFHEGQVSLMNSTPQPYSTCPFFSCICCVKISNKYSLHPPHWALFYGIKVCRSGLGDAVENSLSRSMLVPISDTVTILRYHDI